MNEIVIAQDGSPSAQAAADVAIQFAQARGLSVHGLYVVDEMLALDSYANLPSELAGDIHAASRDELLGQLAGLGDAALRMLEARCRAAHVPVTAELLTGGVPEMLLLESERAQMLAIGRRGSSHAGDPHRLGQRFRTVAHQAHVPLIIGGDKARPVRRLLLATNGSERARAALGWASLLRSSLPAEVMVVAVQEHEGEPGSDRLAGAQALLPGCTCLHRRGQPAHEIIAAAVETQADMILMGRYRHLPLMEWLIGSTVDQVLRGTQLPVLMV